MEAGTYAVEAEVEETHWWFVNRRRLFGRMIQSTGTPGSGLVLDLGTGTGANLRMLRSLGFDHRAGLDQSPEAIRACASKGLGHVRQGDLCDLPFETGSAALVLATDVLEHIEDDDLALGEVARVLAPGGHVLFTVPAFRCLWGLQDQVARHKRRYRKGRFLEQIRAAGLEPVQQFYFNYLLFVPIWAARAVLRAVKPKLDSENQLNSPSLNWLLTRIFSLDVLTAPRLKPPFGVSILALCKKPGANDVPPLLGGTTPSR